MLNYQEEQQVKKIVNEVIAPVAKTVEKTAVVVDKIFKMFVDLKQEHAIAKAKINKHDKRLRKVEKKLKITSPSDSVIFT